jgi:hypothetical protein
VPINVRLLASSMLQAARSLIAERWDDIRSIVEIELRKFATTVGELERLQRVGEIDAERARLLFELQCRASRAVLKEVCGIDAGIADRVVDSAVHSVGSLALRMLGINN